MAFTDSVAGALAPKVSSITSTPPGTSSRTCSWMSLAPMHTVTMRSGDNCLSLARASSSRAATTMRAAPNANASSVAPTPSVPEAPRIRMLCPGRSADLRIAE
ncbi:hypothetical protein D9M68_988700 [compost metagenome]